MKTYLMLLWRVAVLLVVLSCGGPVESSEEGPQGAPESLTVSPDGKFIAYLSSRGVEGGVGLETVMLSQAMSVHWASVDDLHNEHMLEICKCGREWDGYSLYAQVHLTPFSPDSRHIAVIDCRDWQTTIIDVQANKHWTLEGAGSFAWLDSTHIGYVRSNGDGEFRRAFWRQEIHDGPGERTAIHRDAGGRVYTTMGGRVEWAEHWSPDGGFVLFRGPLRDEQAYLLDIGSGTVRALGPAGTVLQRVAWSPDGSRVVWVCWNRKASSFQGLLLGLPNGETAELPEQFHQLLPQDWSERKYYDLQWTPEGDFIVLNSVDDGGCLIRPEPWEVRFLGKKVMPSESVYEPAPGTPVYPPEIHAQPAPGVLLANTFPWIHRHTLIDYTGQTLQVLDGRQFPSLVVFPDGHRAAVMYYPKTIRVVELGPLATPPSDSP